MSSMNELHHITARLESLRREAQDISEQLGSMGLDANELLNAPTLERILREIAKLRESFVYQSLARVDFRDDYYRLIRTIDGDTIVVEPPNALKPWLNDIHVRLYGLETPELWEPLGQDYREHLNDFCEIDAGRRLMIVWERERLGTNYEGFPLSSFERGIGHVFYLNSRGNWTYINALMHLMRFSSISRGGKSLLRGRSRLDTLDLRLPWTGPCPTPIPIKPESSSSLRLAAECHPPACLLDFPRLPNLDPRDSAFHQKLARALQDESAEPCPIRSDLTHYWHSLEADFSEQRASPFDLPLSLLSKWAAQQRGEAA